jgi:hypothetical protein
MTMKFNVSGAKEAGYSDAEIRQFLLSMPETAKAKEAGYSDDEVLAHFGLSAPNTQTGVVEDVAKGAAAGLAKGAAAIPGVFGDVHELAKMAPWAPKRSMYDAVAERIGFAFPTSQDTVGAAARAVPGIDYKPQTLPGQFANSMAQFVPGALLGGEANLASAGRNAMRFGVIPGATSELAGQAFSGTPYEGAARTVGGIAGLAGGGIPGRIVSPIRQRPELAGAVSVLEGEGVPLTAGQKTGNKTLQWAEAAAADMPFSAKSAADIQAEQGAALNTAFAKRMGYKIDNSQGLLDENEWRKIGEQFTQRYGDLTGKYTLQMDKQLGQDLIDAEKNYVASVGQSEIAPVIRNSIDDILVKAAEGNAIDGATYQRLRSRLEKAATKTSDVEKANALRDIKRALDSAMDRSITAAGSPEDVAAWRQLNSDYANYKTLESAAAGADAGSGMGYISPGRVRAESTKNKKRYLTGGNDLSRLSKAATAAMKPLPSSGTAQRQAAMNLFQPATAAAGMAAGGIPGFIAGYAAPPLMARALMSRPMQNYLANQMATRLGLSAPITGGQAAFNVINAMGAGQ